MATVMQAPPAAGELEGLTHSTRRSIAEGRPGYTAERGRAFLRFRSRLAAELLNHRVITSNRYTAWFSTGRQSEAQVKAFVVQFSVFSNQFLVAQFNKVINADTLEGMRASKEILANELGVTFNKARESRSATAARASATRAILRKSSRNTISRRRSRRTHSSAVATRCSMVSPLSGTAWKRSGSRSARTTQPS